MRLATASEAICRRFFSATIISSSWRLLRSMSCKTRASSSGGTLGGGPTAPAKRARTSASILSVLARRPAALAKSRACLGLTTATAIPAAATATAAGRSYLPVASKTTKSGRTPSRSRARSSSMPARSLATEKISPSGSEQTSRCSLEDVYTDVTDGPLGAHAASPYSFDSFGLADTGSASVAGALATVRAPPIEGGRDDPCFLALLRRSPDQGGIGLSRPRWPHFQRPQPRYKGGFMKTQTPHHGRPHRPAAARYVRMV